MDIWLYFIVFIYEMSQYYWNQTPYVNIWGTVTHYNKIMYKYLLYNYPSCRESIMVPIRNLIRNLHGTVISSLYTSFMTF